MSRDSLRPGSEHQFEGEILDLYEICLIEYISQIASEIALYLENKLNKSAISVVEKDTAEKYFNLCDDLKQTKISSQEFF